MDSKFNQFSAKKRITQFAEKATQKIKQNTNIARTISEIEGYIDITKNILKKYSKATEPPQAIQKKIKGELLSVIDMLRTKNLKLRKDNQATQTKQASLIKTLKLNSQQSSELDNVRKDNFLLSNALLEKEAVIRKISVDINMLKRDYGLLEYSRDFFISDPLEFVDEFEDMLKDRQDALLKLSRVYNKHKNKYSRLAKEKSDLKKSINDFIEKTHKKEDNKNTDCNTKPNTSDNDRLNELTIENDKHENVDYYQPQEEEVDIFEDVDLELNSDEDVHPFEAKVFDLKMLSNTHEDKVKGQVPKIDLKQIEFNKLKIKPEVDEDSLERRDNNESVDSQIRQLNNRIKTLKKRKSKGDEKIVRYGEYFAKISKQIDSAHPNEGRSCTVFGTVANNTSALSPTQYRNQQDKSSQLISRTVNGKAKGQFLINS